MRIAKSHDQAGQALHVAVRSAEGYRRGEVTLTAVNAAVRQALEQSVDVKTLNMALSDFRLAWRRGTESVIDFSG